LPSARRCVRSREEHRGVTGAQERTHPSTIEEIWRYIADLDQELRRRISQLFLGLEQLATLGPVSGLAGPRWRPARTMTGLSPLLVVSALFFVGWLVLTPL
jgi:hypothetical protein